MWLVFNYFNAWILTKITKKIGTRRLRKRKLKFFGLKCETIITKTSLVFWKSLFFSRSRFIIQVFCPLSLTLFSPPPIPLSLYLSIYLSIFLPNSPSPTPLCLSTSHRASWIQKREIIWDDWKHAFDCEENCHQLNIQADIFRRLNIYEKAFITLWFIHGIWM